MADLRVYDCGCVEDCRCPQPNTDTFVRKAQTVLPGGKIVEREWNVRERFMLYRDGWADGAAIRAIRKTHEGLGPYDRGYADGRKARSEALDAEANRIGYEPTILRAAQSSGPDQEKG